MPAAAYDGSWLSWLVDTMPGAYFLLMFLWGASFVMERDYGSPPGSIGNGGAFDSGIQDVGFRLTAGLYRWFKRSPVGNDVVAGLNTLAGFGGVLAVMPRYGPRDVICVGLLFFGRALMGMATMLPRPQEYIGSKWDFPQTLWTLSASATQGWKSAMAMPLDETDRFFLFWSGHVTYPQMAAVRCWESGRKGWRVAAVLIQIANLTQALRMIAIRGHYTIDVLAGLLVGWAAARISPGRLGDGLSLGPRR